MITAINVTFMRLFSVDSQHLSPSSPSQQGLRRSRLLPCSPCPGAMLMQPSPNPGLTARASLRPAAHHGEEFCIWGLNFEIYAKCICCLSLVGFINSDRKIYFLYYYKSYLFVILPVMPCYCVQIEADC